MESLIHINKAIKELEDKLEASPEYRMLSELKALRARFTKARNPIANASSVERGPSKKSQAFEFAKEFFAKNNEPAKLSTILEYVKQTKGLDITDGAFSAYIGYPDTPLEKVERGVWKLKA